MASWLILLIKQFLDIIKYIMIGNAIFDNKYDRNNKKIFLYGLLIILIYLIFNIYLKYIWVELNLIICIFSLLLIFNNRLIITTKIIISTILIVTLLEQFIDLFIKYNYNDFLSTEFIVSNILKFLFVLLIVVIIKITRGIYNKQYNLVEITGYIYMNIIFGFSATLFPMFIVEIYRNILHKRVLISVSIIAYLNIIICVVSIYLFVKNKREKEKYHLDNLVKDHALKLQEDYYQKLINNYSNIRHFKHDLRGHLNIINGLILDYENEKASDYINEISKSIINKDIYHTNNIYISTILNSFDQILKDENIKFELSYYINNHIIMENMDICSLFYNLISNAIESNLKIKDNRYIKLYIAEIKNNIVIKILNPVDKDFNLDIIKEYRTTKQDKENHGFGLITINNIVSKYRGSIDYEVMDTNLIIDIVLFNTLKL